MIVAGSGESECRAYFVVKRRGNTVENEYLAHADVGSAERYVARLQCMTVRRSNRYLAGVPLVEGQSRARIIVSGSVENKCRAFIVARHRRAHTHTVIKRENISYKGLAEVPRIVST